MTQKLRILCLHGYNNTSEIMMFQMQNYINTYGDMCEFTFLDGPMHVRPQEKPIKYFVKKGIKPPFKAWTLANKEAYRQLDDGKSVL